MEKPANKDMIDWVIAQDTKKELGSLSLSSVSEAERRLMHEAVVYDRVFLMTTAIRCALLDRSKDPKNDKKLIGQSLTRLGKFERYINGENVDEEDNYINFWEVGKFVKSQDPKAGSDTRILNMLYRSSQYSPPADGSYLAGIFVTHIDNIVSLRTDVPTETPLLERWVVDMRVLEEAYNNGTLRRINGISDKRLRIFKALINHWKGEDSSDWHAPEPTSDYLIR